MPNRIELEIARDAAKAILETSLGKNAIKAVTPLAEEGQNLLSQIPGARKLADVGHRLAEEFPGVSSMFVHESNPLFSFQGKASGTFSPINETSVHTIDYKGWSNCVELKNSQSSAVVVPQTGRIASFKRVGDENVFWENDKLTGKSPGSTSEWMNFGGDKVWPAPQSKWSTLKNGVWPPPPEFDQMPVKITMHADGITTTSAMNPELGIRLVRRLTLKDSVMDVTNSFEKVDGKPVEVSVWSVAQLRDPKLVAFPIRISPEMPQGFNTQMGTGIPSFETQNGIASFFRDLHQEHKIGTPSDTLLWVGEKSMLRMKAENYAGATYPDGGSATEIYTNNKLPYIELETLGPVTKLSQGQKATHQVRYELFSAD